MIQEIAKDNTQMMMVEVGDGGATFDLNVIQN